VPEGTSGEARASGNQRRGGPTVDGDSNALRESEAVLTEEGGDLAELVGLEVLNRGVLGVGVNNVELEVVGLRNRLDGGGAGVVLRRETSVSVLSVSLPAKFGSVYSYISPGEESAKSHLDCVPDELEMRWGRREFAEGKKK
jgi:hypothetical protein